MIDEFTSPREASVLAGGLSDPGKMPGKGWSISAHRCVCGSKLREVPNSICSTCYAHKGRYPMDTVQNAQERRFMRYERHGSTWVDLMVLALQNERWFRWLDSGDLQTDTMLERILDVCERTPDTRHWLPTREYKLVERVLRRRTVPANLQIRLSAHMIDGPAPSKLAERYGIGTSQVLTDNWDCPAKEQGNSCQDCRRCWDPGVTNVSYPLH